MIKETEETTDETIGRWKELREQVASLLKAFGVESAQAASLLEAFEVESARVEKIATDARQYAENIVDTMHEPFLVVLNKDLKVVLANRSFYQTFKISPKETEGRFLYDLGNRQWDIPALRKLLEEILPKNTAFDDYEVEHTFPEIGQKIMLLNASRIYREQSKTEMILLAIEDVTQARQLEEELKKHRQRLEELVKEQAGEIAEEKEQLDVTLRSIGDGVIATDPQGRIVLVNRKAEDLTGFKEKEAKGRPLQEIFYIIVDDKPILQEAYGMLLEANGHVVVGRAYNGNECLSEIKGMKVRPDMIIMDHRMPQKSGLATTRELLKLNPDFKIIFVSADISVKKEALAAGAVAFFEKPFHIDSLLASIDKIISPAQSKGSLSSIKDNLNLLAMFVLKCLGRVKPLIDLYVFPAKPAPLSSCPHWA